MKIEQLREDFFNHETMQQINFAEGYPKEKLTAEQYIILYRRIYREIREELKDKI